MNGKPVEPDFTHWGELTVKAGNDSHDADGLTVRIQEFFLPNCKNRRDNAAEPTGDGDPSLIEIFPKGTCSTVKLNNDTFLSTSCNSSGFPNNWLVVRHPGDNEFARATYQISVIPADTRRGQEQAINFASIADVKFGTKEIALQANSSVAGMKVSFHVISGPAELVDGDKLRFTPIPPAAKFPVKVIVMACQIGRSKEPQVRRADL
jgi:hypothetical protein